jgi:hypothetical protein
LRVGRAIGKTEAAVAHDLMAQLKERGHPDAPPPLATDGNGDYRTALVDTWGQVPDYGGRGRPPTRKQPHADWQYVQVVKERSGYRLTAVHVTVVYGAPDEVLAQVGGQTSYSNPKRVVNKKRGFRGATPKKKFLPTLQIR